MLVKDAKRHNYISYLFQEFTFDVTDKLENKEYNVF